MIPPPPPQASITLSEQRKRKKRFELAPVESSQQSDQDSYNNPFIPKPPLMSLANDMLLVPYIHYGLNRNLTVLTLLDRENILTKSPTLVSFGGSSFELGYQKTLLMLDLDPATKYSKDGGLDTSFEYDWKPIQTTNNQVFEKENFTCIFGNMIYSKRNQAIYVFGRGWSKSWVASLSLKTLSWKMKDVSINHHYDQVKFAISQNDDQFLICHSASQYYGPFYISLCSFRDLENMFMDEEVRVGLTSIEEPILVENSEIQSKMTAPISDGNKVALYGSTFYDCQKIHIMDFAENIDKRQFVQFEYPENSYILEIPPHLREFKSKQQLLVSTSGSFYKCNIVDRKTKLLKCSKSAIIMKHHKLFPPFMAFFKTRKDENQIVYITNNDVLFILKLDYSVPSYAFRNKLGDIYFSDISIQF